MRGAVVGDGRCGEIVPPLARGTLGKEGVCIGEQGGVGEGFLRTSQRVVNGMLQWKSAYCVVLPRALPLPQVLHLLWLELVQ